MREKKRGLPAVVSVGYKKSKKDRGLIKGMEPVIVRNVNDLEKVNENQAVFLGNIGKRKKIEVAKKAREKKIQIQNLNVKKFLKKVEKKDKPKEREKDKGGKK